MRFLRGVAALTALVLILSSVRSKTSDQLTTLIASPLVATTQGFPGTDGKWHVVYELVLTNTSPTTAALQKIEVVDAANPSVALATFEGNDLVTHLRTLASTPAASAEIAANETRLFLIDFALDESAHRPGRLLHRFHLLGAAMPARAPVTPVALDYTIAPEEMRSGLREIGPPLAGKGWAVINGCCEVGGAHRSAGLPVNGKIYFAQRFAIDWMKLDNSGRLIHGDPADVHSYPDYGAEVLAVADGTVVDTLETLDDQTPGQLPDPKTITLENVDGNHVVIDIGGGEYAFYAHMQKNSLKVSVGDHVKRGQVLGKLGNTGNTSGPHLHFHLMDGPSVLGSSGLPYVIDSFVVAGKIPEAEFEAASGPEGDWSKGLSAQPSPRRGQFPMDLTIVNFSGEKRRPTKRP